MLKLLFQEPESNALQDWLTTRPRVPVVSSELAKVEVLRATRRIDASGLADARSLLPQLDLVPLTGPVVDRAGELDEVSLRSLEALHLASVLTLGADLTALVAYDQRLLEAAALEGLETAQPGA